MRIQHNITAMNSYRNYNTNNSALAKNLEKLSSGYKVNRAGDDAAGLAISEKMRAQITGIEGATKNAKDGISLIQTAEGALTEVHSMLNRMTSLAEQSANGTYDNEVDRTQLQKEIESLKSEIDRVADSTNYNGIKLLDGSLGGGVISYTGTVALGADISDFANAKSTGSTAFDNTAAAKLAATSKALTDTFDVDGQTLSIDWSKGEAAKVYEKLKSVTATTNTDGYKGLADDLTKLLNDEMKAQGLSGSVKVTVKDKKFTLESLNESSSGTVGWTGNNASTADAGAKSLGTLLFSKVAGQGSVNEAGKTVGTAFAKSEAFTMTINGTKVQAKFTKAFSKGDSLDDLASAVQDAIKAVVKAYNTANGYSAGHVMALETSAFTVEADKSGGLKVSYNGEKDVKFSFGEWIDEETGKPGKIAGLLGLADASSIKGGARGLTLQIGDTAEKFNKMTVSVNDMHVRALGIDGVDISTQDGAADAMKKIKDAINQVSDTRGGLGALQNRLDHTINNLGVMRENIQNAESLIRDTDVAEEMMTYTKTSILTQSAQAMLAQANQLPQGVLQLLG